MSGKAAKLPRHPRHPRHRYLLTVEEEAIVALALLHYDTCLQLNGNGRTHRTINQLLKQLEPRLLAASKKESPK